MTKLYVPRRAKAFGELSDFNGAGREEKKEYGLLSCLWSKQRRLSHVLMIPTQNDKP